MLTQLLEKNFLNNTFNKKIANKLTKAPIYMLVLEIVLVQLLLACALALMCALQLCLHAFALRAGNWAIALHIQVEHILSEGQRSPSGKQFAVLFLPPMVSWVVDRHHGHVGCCPEACLIQSIVSWGNSLHVPSPFTSIGRKLRFGSRSRSWSFVSHFWLDFSVFSCLCEKKFKPFSKKKVS